MWPTLLGRVAFASAPFAGTASWSDVSADLRRIEITRGRQSELDQVEAGRATVVLKNAHGNYWPRNASGAYYPNVLPGKRINLRAVYPTALVFATFDAADSASALPTAETLQAWTANAGTWGITSNKAYSVAGGGGSLASINTGRLDHSAAATVVAANYATHAPGLAVRCIDFNNFLYVLLSSTAVSLWKIAGGVGPTQLATAAYSPVNATSYLLAVTAEGNTITGTIDGVTQFTYTLTGADVTTFRQETATRCGLTFSGLSGTTVTWDNFYAKPIGATSGTPIVYDLYTGFVESWEPGFGGEGFALPVVTVTAADLFEALANYQINDATGYSQERSDVRVGNVLDDLGWPAADRSLAVGQSTLQASGTITATPALSHLRTVELSESGLLFVAPSGTVVWQDRHARFKSPYIVSQATYGDGAGELPYHDVTFAYEKIRIWNDVRLTRTGGNEQAVSDATSQADYGGVRTLQRTGLLQTADSEVLDQANYLLSRYKDAAQRVRSLTILPERQPDDEFPDVLGLDISTRITVRQDDGSVDEDYHIEGGAHDIDFIEHTWATRWQLSPADAQMYFALGVATLGETTRLGY